jgi:Holliday junction resolvase RusA-like endonuclease
MADDYWYCLGLNPEPWAVGDIGIGRKGGKHFARMSPNANLASFQEAVREALEGCNQLPLGEYKLTFYLWRQQVQYLNSKDKRVTRNQADATNMQKALEDALQGVLFDNDRNVRDIRTVIVEQGKNVKPAIVIHAQMAPELNPDEIPNHIWDAIDAIGRITPLQGDLKYESAEDLF